MIRTKNEKQLKKMVATTQLRFALETEEETRTKKDWISFRLRLEYPFFKKRACSPSNGNQFSSFMLVFIRFVYKKNTDAKMRGRK